MQAFEQNRKVVCLQILQELMMASCCYNVGERGEHKRQAFLTRVIKYIPAIFLQFGLLVFIVFKTMQNYTDSFIFQCRQLVKYIDTSAVSGRVGNIESNNIYYCFRHG